MEKNKARNIIVITSDCRKKIIPEKSGTEKEYKSRKIRL